MLKHQIKDTMLTKNLAKEDMSFAYLMALSASNGFGFEIKRRDNDGVDVLLTQKGRLADECTKSEGVIGVQLKSTINWRITGSQEIAYDLDADNYNQLVAKDIIVPRILVLLCLPKEEEHWISVTVEELVMRKCAYWMSLRGEASTHNNTSKTIHIPAHQLLTPDALKDLMYKAQCEDL